MVHSASETTPREMVGQTLSNSTGGVRRLPPQNQPFTWSNDCELWGSYTQSNTDFIQRLHLKTVQVLSALWYVSNRMLHVDTKTLFVRDVVIERVTTNALWNT